MIGLAGRLDEAAAGATTSASNRAMEIAAIAEVMLWSVDPDASDWLLDLYGIGADVRYLVPRGRADAGVLPPEPCAAGGPRPVFICPFVVLTDERGEMYNAMRGIQGQSKDTVDEHGHLQAQRRARRPVPDAVPWADAPVSEPYWVAEDRDAVSYVGDTFRFDFGVDRYRWEDAGGRVELEARRLGQVCTFWVP